MYGALATMMLFMFWLYFCMYFMLMAAEANVFFQESFSMMVERIKHKFSKRRRAKWKN
jgi:membrane protein